MKTQHFVNPFKPSVAFHIQTSHLIYITNQMNVFHMKCNTGILRVKPQDRPWYCDQANTCAKLQGNLCVNVPHVAMNVFKVNKK